MPKKGLAAMAAGVRKQGRSKPTLLACDNCRVKRLKCTYNERPCMNCKLYQKECIQSGGLRSGNAARQSSNEPSATTVEHLASTQNEAPVAPTHVGNTSDFFNPPEVPTMPQGHGDVAATSLSNFDSLNCSDHPYPFTTATQLTAGGDNRSQQYMQLDELFENEVLRSNVPFHDFSFLGDLVNESPNPLPGGNFAEESVSTSATRRHQEQAGTPFSKTTPISPYHPHENKLSGIDSLQPTSRKEVSKHHIPPGLFIGIDQGRCGFLGWYSIGGTLASSIRTSMTKYPRLTSNLNFEWLVQAGKHIARVDTDETVQLSVEQLPPKSVATMCIAAYFTNVHIYYPVVREQHFQASWETLYDPNQETHRVSSYILFCLVITIGAASDRTNSAASSPLDQFARDVFQKACTLVYSQLTESSLVTLQVMLLLIMFFELNGQVNLASILCGLSIRLCQSLGLHRKSPQDFNLAPEEINFRARLWWMTFRFETFVAMSEGRPTAVRELTYDVEVLPMSLDHNISPYTGDLSSAIHGWTARLTEHCNRFSTISSLCISTNARLDALNDLDDSLMRWKGQIPISHQPGQDVVADVDSYMLIAPLHLEYFNLLRAVHWACIMTISMNSDAVDGRHRRSLQVSEMKCLSASRSFVQTANSIADCGSGGRLFPIALHTDHYVAVSAVLYRAICENPRRIAAKVDLEHLRATIVHIERDSFSCEWSSTLKNTIGEMIKVAEQLVQGGPESANVGISTTDTL